jgi:hypothetical protein
MIDAQTRVATEGTSVIFPEGVDPFARVQSSQRVGPAMLDQASIASEDQCHNARFHISGVGAAVPVLIMA